MLYFSINEILDGKDYFLAQNIKNVECASHIHYSPEIIVVTDGELTVGCGDSNVTLSKGYAIYVMPFQFHSFHTESSSRASIFTFSAELVPEFAQFTGNKKATAPIFEVSSSILDLCNSFNYTEYHNNNKLSHKAILYPICDELIKKCRFSEGDNNNDPSFTKVLFFIHKHISEDISLPEVAKALGYNYKYLSRMFKQTSGMCFSNFLAALRCANAASMLTDYDNQHKSIAEIAFESGFTSIRNFNRTFKKFHGITPRELKNAKLKTRS